MTATVDTHLAPPQILLVDDNPTNLQILYQTLNGHGYRLLVAKSGKDAMSIAERALPDLIMLDVMMPELDGFETCRRLKENPATRDTTIIFLSARTEASDKVRGLDLGGVDYVTKPFQAEEVLARVRTHLKIRQLDQELRRRNTALEHELSVAQELLRDARERSDGVLLGDSVAVQRLREDIAAAATADAAPLLISGPPGSDHEAVARAIHDQSPRARRAIICVSCLASGADTTIGTGGAGGDILAKLPLADGGSLYLEGVQHLSHDQQRTVADLLGEIDAARCASLPPHPDVRIIVSTTRTVDEEIAAGRLLPELRRRLRTIDLAPLRERIDDLPALTNHILKRQAEQAGRIVPPLSPAALKRLQSYRWPGNFRELRSVLECAVATSVGPELDVSEQLLDDSVRVGSYSLLERIGSGGMGEVWLARHHLLARPAAVKLLRVAVRDDEKALRQRFEREAHATAELQSPHTVQLYDFGVTDSGSFYYVMERLRGMDLQRMVTTFGPMPPARTIYFLKQACRSLSEAHGHGLVHRDIKPANLFVCRLGPEYDFLKVLDFGVVSRQGRETAIEVTAAGTLLGTPAFLAPELASPDGVFDGRSDLYSLGCVGFWLLTGRLPFEGDALAQLMHHSKTVPSAPSAVAEERIPAALDAVILACMAKDAADRPANADLLWEQLDQIRTGEEWTRQAARAWWDQHAPDLVEA